MLGALLVTTACGQDDVPRSADAARSTAAAPAKSGAVESYSFVLEPTEIDLGVLRPDQGARFEFAIVNQDARPLRIVNIDGTCDCVSFTWNRAEIAPGGRTVVKTNVVAENRGTKMLAVYVQALDRAVTTKQVAIRYSVQSELAFEPPRADFGRRVLGSPTTLEVVVSYVIPKETGPIALEPRLAAPIPVAVTVDPVPEVLERAGGLREVRTKVRLVLDTSRAVPSFETDLVFTSDRHVGSRLVVTGTVHDGVYLDVDQLHLGVASAGEKRRGNARLHWTRGEPKIERIECQPPELTASAVREGGSRSFRIVVELQAKTTGDFDGVVQIVTDRAPEPLLLRVKAKIR